MKNSQNTSSNADNVALRGMISDSIILTDIKVFTTFLPEIVFETNLEGVLTFVNLKAIDVFKYGSDFYSNKIKFIELISKQDRRRCAKDLDKIITDGGSISELEYTAVTNYRREFPVTLHVTKIFTSNVFVGLNILMLDKTAQKNVKNYQENLSFLSKSALSFLTLPSDDDIFLFVGKNLSKFASKSTIIVFSYDNSSNISKIRYISGLYPYIEDVASILGKPPEEFDINFSEKFKRKYLSDKTLKKLDSLADINEKWSAEKAEMIERALNVDSFYSMGIKCDGILYGGLLIATQKGVVKPIDEQTIETFIYQAGVALHRKQIDNELMKAKLVAEESDRLKSAFLANMSHELRTPLNGILGLAQVMLNADDTNPDVKNNVKMIVDSGKSLLSLIEDIMDVSKIEADELKIQRLPMSLNAIMEQLRATFEVNPIYQQKKNEITLLCDKPTENINIISDPDRLKQIFINLIGNALKFTQKGFIKYGYSINNDEILFYVRDTGIGIPKDKTETMFGRFIQADNTLTRKHKGSGLGLAISKGLVALLGGQIWCESDLGKGANFYFTVPYVPTTQTTKADASQETGDMVYQWSDYTILIVEDDIINFMVLKAMLRTTNVKIIHADSGLKAIENVYANPQINLVLMDVHLPEMSGLEATGKILEINPALPVIAQTANAITEDRKKCLNAGCADYISKPIDMQELLGKIAALL